MNSDHISRQQNNEFFEKVATLLKGSKDTFPRERGINLGDLDWVAQGCRLGKTILTTLLMEEALKNSLDPVIQARQASFTEFSANRESQLRTYDLGEANILQVEELRYQSWEIGLKGGQQMAVATVAKTLGSLRTELLRLTQRRRPTEHEKKKAKLLEAKLEALEALKSELTSLFSGS